MYAYYVNNENEEEDSNDIDEEYECYNYESNDNSIDNINNDEISLFDLASIDINNDISDNTSQYSTNNEYNQPITTNKLNESSKVQDKSKINKYDHITSKYNKNYKIDSKIDNYLENSTNVDIHTGQKLYQPIINDKSKSIISKKRNTNQPIEDVLQSYGINYQLKAKLRNDKQLLLLNKQRSNTIKLNNTSKQILLEKDKLNSNRLNQPIGNLKKSVLNTIDKPTFKPRINDKSIEIVNENYGYYYQSSQSDNSSIITNNRSNHDNLFYANEFVDNTSEIDSYYDIDDGVQSLLPDSPTQSIYSLSNINSSNDPVNVVHMRSINWEKQKLQKIQIEKIKNDKEIDKMCTFQPKLNDKSFLSNTNISHKVSSNIPIADRQLDWMKKREEKLEIERKKREESLLEGYTFKPNRVTVNNNTNNNSSSSAKIKVKEVDKSDSQELSQPVLNNWIDNISNKSNVLIRPRNHSLEDIEAMRANGWD